MLPVPSFVLHPGRPRTLRHPASMYTALATLGLLVASATAAPSRASAPVHKISLSARKTSGQPSRSFSRRASGDVPLADYYAGTDLQSVLLAL